MLVLAAVLIVLFVLVMSTQEGTRLLRRPRARMASADHARERGLESVRRPRRSASGTAAPRRTRRGLRRAPRDPVFAYLVALAIAVAYFSFFFGWPGCLVPIAAGILVTWLLVAGERKGPRRRRRGDDAAGQRAAEVFD